MRYKLTFPLSLIALWLLLFLRLAVPSQAVNTVMFNPGFTPKKPTKVKILMYHKVNPHPASGGLGLRVNPINFAEQMELLKTRGYSVISFDRFMEARNGNRPLPPKPLIITFDDGYADNYNYAFPILKKYRYPATVFLVYNQIGGTNLWDRALNFPTNKLLNWDQIKEMARNDITFGSHTLNHPHLPELTTAEITKEITDSKILLEKNLKQPVDYFCYPYGDFNKDITQAVEAAGYKAAVTVRPGDNDEKTNPFTLKRIRVMGTYDKARFIEELEKDR